MTVLEKLEASLDEMYEFSNKMYAAMDKSGKDRRLAELITEASERDTMFSPRMGCTLTGKGLSSLKLKTVLSLMKVRRLSLQYQ